MERAPPPPPITLFELSYVDLMEFLRKCMNDIMLTFVHARYFNIFKRFVFIHEQSCVIEPHDISVS